MIRPATPADARSICDIYNHYVLNTSVTFEEEIVTVDEMVSRVSTHTAEHPWLVFTDNGLISDYAYAGLWKSRSAYRYSLESTVYLHPHFKGKGIGTLLYENLFKELEKFEARTVVGGIALPNEGSIALHEKFGFKKVAHFTEVGFKFGQWIDVGYWEKKLK